MGSQLRSGKKPGRSASRRRAMPANPSGKLSVRTGPKTGKSTIRSSATHPASDDPVDEKEPKGRLSLQLPVSLLERAKNAVYWTPGLTMTDLVITALNSALDEMEKKRGTPFPPRNGSLRVGRPLKQT